MRHDFSRHRRRSRSLSERLMGSYRVRHGAAGGPEGVAPRLVLDRGRVARDEEGDGDDPLIGGAGADALIGVPIATEKDTTIFIGTGVQEADGAAADM